MLGGGGRYPFWGSHSQDYNIASGRRGGDPKP